MIQWPVNTQNNKYKRWYELLVSRAQNRTLNDTVYVERHHIIPRSIGGNNSKLNIAILTAREHFICHRLLTKFLEGNSKMKMSFASWIMVTNNNPHQKRYKVNSRVYETIRKEMAEFQRTPDHIEKVKTGLRNSEKQKNKVIWNKGIPVTDEQRKRLREANLGKKLSPETIKKIRATLEKNGTIRKPGMWSPSLEAREKLRKANLGKKASEETKRKISLANKGRKITDEQRKKYSEAKKGKPLSEQHVDSIRLAQARRRAREAQEKKETMFIGPLKPNTAVEYRGVWYKNLEQAAKAYGKSRGALQRQIKAFGNTPTPEICQAIDNKTVKWPRLPITEETRRKISQSQIGKIVSIETRKKQSISAKNRPPISDETRQKLSKASKGRKMSRESIKKQVTK